MALGHLPPKSANILEAVLYRGQLGCGDAAGVVITGERQARRIVSALLEHGVLVSDSPRAPLRLAFPAALASRWMPGLFPEKRPSVETVSRRSNRRRFSGGDSGRLPAR
jgi:hypothetical protein